VLALGAELSEGQPACFGYEFSVGVSCSMLLTVGFWYCLMRRESKRGQTSRRSSSGVHQCKVLGRVCIGVDVFSMLSYSPVVKLPMQPSMSVVVVRCGAVSCRLEICLFDFSLLVALFLKLWLCFSCDGDEVVARVGAFIQYFEVV